MVPGEYGNFPPGAGGSKVVSIVRIVHLLASYLLMPLLVFTMLWRGLRNRAYLQRWGERFALKRACPSNGIVLHASSVGELNAAAPLIRALREKYPGLPFTVTTFTPAGSERVRSLFGHDIDHAYSPLDLPGAVGRFLDQLRPRLLVIMETEIWPHLFRAAGKRGIPILLANGRISDRSFPRYRRFRALIRPALREVSRIAAQSAVDADRFREIGAAASRVEVSGNLKFDVSPPPQLAERAARMRAAWGPDRPVFLVGSSHEGDEVPALGAFAGILRQFPRALLVLVPRRPERFQRAAQLAQASGLRVQMLSAGLDGAADSQCLVVDAMGELWLFYAACDVAFVGGSLQMHGGHNMLEPAALGIPVVIGPHTFNFAEISARLLESGGALRVGDAQSLERAVIDLLGDPALRRRTGDAGLALVRSGQGALARTLRVASELLDHSSSSFTV